MICRLTHKSGHRRQPTSVSVDRFNIPCDSDFDNLPDSDADEADSFVTDVDGLDSEEQSLGSDHEESYSGDEVSDDDDIDQSEIKRGPLDKRWKLDKTFQSEKSLNEFLTKESWWSYRSKNACTDGTKILYRCNRVKRNSKNPCEAGIYVIESMNFGDRNESRNDDVSVKYSLYRKNAVHTHNRSPEYKQNVTDKVKKMIIEQYDNGRKPKKITFAILDDTTVQMKDKPSYKQVLRIITNYQNSGSGSAPLTMGKLTEFVQQHLKVPNGDDEAFIVRFERSPKTQQHDKFFRFFITTKRLLRNIANSNIVQLDATHKVKTSFLENTANSTIDRLDSTPH